MICRLRRPAPLVRRGLAPIERTSFAAACSPRKGVIVGRIYPQEFRDQIVALHRNDGRTFADIAEEFSLSATTVAKWVRVAEDAERPASGKREEVTVPAQESDRERIARLERELAKKKEEVEILGKALAFFARRSER